MYNFINEWQEKLGVKIVCSQVRVTTDFAVHTHTHHATHCTPSAAMLLGNDAQMFSLTRRKDAQWLQPCSKVLIVA